MPYVLFYPISVLLQKKNTHFIMKSKYLNFIVILCFLVSFSAFSQQPEHYSNGQIKAEGKYKKDVKTGDWTYYSEDGKVTLKESYDRKTPNMKTVIYYHPNGKTGVTGTYINNKKYFEWTWYYENGTKKVIGQYSNDQRSGIQTYYNEDGSLDKKGAYINENQYGEWVHYRNGKISLKGVYKNGMPVGEWDSYNELGAIESSAIHKDEYDDIEFYNQKVDGLNFGEKYGNQPYIKTYSNGTTKVLGHTKDRRFEGNWKWYYEDGKLKEEGTFKDHNQNGVWKTYYPNGVLRSEETLPLRLGVYSDLVMYHPNGKIKYKEIGTKAEKFGHYYKTGELHIEVIKSDGKPTVRNYYGKSGNLIRTSN